MEKEIFFKFCHFSPLKKRNFCNVFLLCTQQVNNFHKLFSTSNNEKKKTIQQHYSKIKNYMIVFRDLMTKAGRKNVFFFNFQTPVVRKVGYGDNKHTHHFSSRSECGKTFFQVMKRFVVPLKGNIRFQCFMSTFLDFCDFEMSALFVFS